MEQQIGSCRSADGTRLAYAVYGDRSDRTILFVGQWWFSIELSERDPTQRLFWSRLCEHRQAIAFDWRGTGGSDRAPGDITLARLVEDVTAIRKHAGLASVDLMGQAEGASVCVAVAASDPESVRSLITFDAFAIGARVALPGIIDGLAALTAASFTAGIRAWVDLIWPDSTAEYRRKRTREIQGHVSPDGFVAYLRFISQLDVSAMLPSVEPRTLVVRQCPTPPATLRASREFAAAIADARFATIDERETNLSLTAQALKVVDDFLVDGVTETEAVDAPHGTAIILFADIVDSTALTERLGDSAFHERSAALHTSLRETLAGMRGRVVEGRVLGDGMMAVFASAKDAIQAALRCHDAAQRLELQLHVGLHAGDVIHGENDVHGGTVNIAARVCALSAPGELLVSGTVRDLARTSAGVRFEDRGEHALKGVAEPIRVFGVLPA